MLKKEEVYVIWNYILQLVDLDERVDAAEIKGFWSYKDMNWDFSDYGYLWYDKAVVTVDF